MRLKNRAWHWRLTSLFDNIEKEFVEAGVRNSSQLFCRCATDTFAKANHVSVRARSLLGEVWTEDERVKIMISRTNLNALARVSSAASDVGSRGVHFNGVHDAADNAIFIGSIALAEVLDLV